MKISKQIFLSILCLMMNIILQGSERAIEAKPSPQILQKAAKDLKAIKLSHGNYKFNGRTISGMELVEMWQESRNHNGAAPVIRNQQPTSKRFVQEKPMTVHELKAKIAKIQADNLKVVSKLYNYKINNQGGPFKREKVELKSALKHNEKNQKYHEMLLNQLMNLENEINQTFRKQLNSLEELRMLED